MSILKAVRLFYNGRWLQNLMYTWVCRFNWTLLSMKYLKWHRHT